MRLHLMGHPSGVGLGRLGVWERDTAGSGAGIRREALIGKWQVASADVPDPVPGTGSARDGLEILASYTRCPVAQVTHHV